MKNPKKIKTEYEQKLEEFYDFDGDNIQTEYVLDEYDVGLDTTIMDPEELKKLMGNEYEHVINHFKKTEGTD